MQNAALGFFVVVFFNQEKSEKDTVAIKLICNDVIKIRDI